MEKERFILNEADPTIPDWKNLYLGSEIQSGELNSLLNPNWENSMDRNGPFESTLSSIVSSPAISNAAGNGISIGELIGKLGTFCNSGAGAEISPESHINSANSSRYNTPLSSPPKLNHHQDQNQIRGIFPIPPENHFPAFPHFPGDGGFAERAARLSCFGNENFTGLNPNHGLSESEKLSRVSSGKSLKLKLSQLGNPESKKGFADSDRKTGGTEAAELGESREESSISEQIPVGDLSPKAYSDWNARKRKSIPRGKVREIQISSKADSKIAIENEESCAKRIKSDESSGNEKSKSSEPNGKCRTATEGNQKQSKENSKPSEPPKDYIHVRARRGQATDSHSLAERVRREKISERMKFLQDLVPGCNKVTGKAVMLDEIINYVQSLQRQVEFLSMKLATVNPSGELNMEALLSRDVLQSCGPLPHIVYPFDSSSYGLQSQVSLLSSISNGEETQFSIDSQIATMHRHPSMQLHPMNGFGEAASEVWENDLQSVVQMGTGQSQPQTFHDSGAAAKLKTEL